jgi:L-malate glycosyltransferase
MQRLVFVSHFEHDRMQGEGYLRPGACPVEIVHNAIDLVEWQQRMEAVDRQALPNRLGLQPHHRCITFINRLDDNKNPLGFVAWAEGYTERVENPGDLVFIICGDGPLANDTVLAISNSRISGQFRFLGFMADIAPVLAATHVAVFLPKREGFGLGILECVANGVPVAAPRVGGIPEIFNQDLAQVCLYTPNDWEQLSQRVTHWLAMPAEDMAPWQQRMVQNVQRFSTPQFIERFTQIYQDCAG